MEQETHSSSARAVDRVVFTYMGCDILHAGGTHQIYQGRLLLLVEEIGENL